MNANILNDDKNPDREDIVKLICNCDPGQDDIIIFICNTTMDKANATADEEDVTKITLSGNIGLEDTNNYKKMAYL